MKTNTRAIVREDLALITGETRSLWDALRGRKIFITGGTGFFGAWLLETFAHANREFGLGARAIVLTRDLSAFEKRLPHLAKDPAIRFHLGDVRSFEFPEEHASLILHGASPASASLNESSPLEMQAAIVEGSRRVLNYARLCQGNGADPRVLFISSGAIYGRQPAGISHLSEEFVPQPHAGDPPSAYADGKRAAEALFHEAHLESDLKSITARCFSFVGPYLPLGEGFAIGNFIRDGLLGGPIRVQGDGLPLRSYLYTADLMIQLWTLLVRGPAGQAFNVGSEEAIRLGDLAAKIGEVFRVPVQIAGQPGQGLSGGLYVPSTAKLRSTLNLTPLFTLDQAIARTVRFQEQFRG